MRTPALRFSVCAVISFSLMMAACGSSPTVPTATLSPVAISPNNNASVAQNNASSVCATNAFGITGLTMQFVWTPPTAAGNVVAYEVFATKRDAPTPVLDAMVKGATTYTLTECGAVVINTKLQGWEWRVRGQDARGQFTDWSPWAMYQFSPCRFSDGSLCETPSPIQP